MKLQALRKSGKTALAIAAILLAAAATGCAEKAKTEASVKRFMFWPPAPNDPHIQFLTSINSSADITGGQSKTDAFFYGKQDTLGLPFVRPYGLRFHNGCIYVCDATSGYVSILDLRKKEVRVLGRGTEVSLLKPIDIAVAPDGAKYIADTGHGAIVVFDATDKYAGRIKFEGLRPVAVAVHHNELYVADTHNSRYRVFDRLNGNEIRSFGEKGKEPGQIGGAVGLAVDKDGNLFVDDFLGCRVQKFTPDGQLLASIGGLGAVPGKFVRPKLMSVDADGILYVVDNAFGNVQMFNDKQQFLMFFGGPGHHPGAMDMPAGIATASTDLDLFQQYVHPAFELQRIVLVSNQVGPNKIAIYGLGVLKPGKTVADLDTSRVQGVFGFDGAVRTGGLNLQAPPDDTARPIGTPTQPAKPSPLIPTTQSKPEVKEKPF